MTATNHAITGALLGLSIANPWLVVPVATGSHFLLDMVPHYGEQSNKHFISTRRFRVVLLLDTIAAIVLIATVLVVQPLHWQLAAVGAILAMAPDLMWLPDFLASKRGKMYKALARRARIVRFHKKIQWFERPIGAWVELIWVIGGIILLVDLFKR